MLYLLGEGYKKEDVDKKNIYQFHLSTKNEKYPIGLTEGQGFGGVGGSFAPNEFVKESLKVHLKTCGVEWLIALCEEAVKDSVLLNVKAVLDTYKYLRGTEPPIITR